MTDTSSTDASAQTDETWRAQLSPEQYHVLREAGTEPAFTGKYWNVHEDGSYHCAGCDSLLFASNTKFDSGSGWPSFTAPAVADAIEEREDDTFGMKRIEVVCRTCGGHLGHKFNDGPNGLPRYCINSMSLDLKTS
jgi:peptide-methionine (R)-S-oxide reductase